MNINENIKNEIKIILNINKHISTQKIIKPPLLPVFISHFIHFDKFFHPVVQCENHLICIFMNINENLNMRGNHWLNWYSRELSDLK